MNYPYTAQCPSCHAELNLTQSDMEQANGNIICGNCKTSFYSPNYLLKGFYSSQPKTQKEAPFINSAEKSVKYATNKNDAMSDEDTDILLPPPAKYFSYRRRRVVRSMAVGGTNLVLFVLLLFQLLWLNFEEWVIKEHLHPVYSFLCSIDHLQCQTPLLVELDSLVLEDIDISLKDLTSYEMKAQLVNKDNKPQPFPQINIIFSDINDIAIATGRFSPHQYLLAEVPAGVMGAGEKYDVVLEVRKPSLPVTSYQMHLVTAIK